MRSHATASTAGTEQHQTGGIGFIALSAFVLAILVLSLAAAPAISAPYPPTPTFGPCPNDEFRTGAGASLPDCRAYEQASAPAKGGADVSGSVGLVQASEAGDAITFFSMAGIPGGDGAQDFPGFIARRGASSWATMGMLPPAKYGSSATIMGWTPDLSQVFSNASFNFIAGPAFLSRSTLDGSVTTIDPYRPGSGGIFAGASADGSDVFFQSESEVTPEAAPFTDNLYVWDRDSGTIRLAGVLPDSACGTPPCAPPSGSFAGSFGWRAGENFYTGGVSARGYTQPIHAVSSDGDVFFTQAGTGQVYLRQNASSPAASTVHVSASQRSAPDPNGTKPAIFMDATPSGSLGFFTSCEKLTDDSTAVSTADFSCSLERTSGQGQDLYAYDTASGELADLTVDGDANPKGADVQGVLGTSDDGSYVYFAANGDLDGSGPASLGDCGIPVTQGGNCNLYVWHEGIVTFIAELEIDRDYGSSDSKNWSVSEFGYSVGEQRSARVSADGQTLLFRSQRSLTGYDNNGPKCVGYRGDRGPETPGPCAELYRYSAPEHELICVSCNPTGAPPAGWASLQTIDEPAPTRPDTFSFITTRDLSASGDRVFFESYDKLVEADTNGLLDVYEWEADGSGTCNTAGGCLYLISSGTGSSGSLIGDTSVDGDQVFFFTRDQLVPQDKDGLLDVYAASVGGGLASQNQVAPVPCEGEACRGPAGAPPRAAGAGSVAFSGPADPLPRGKKSRRCPQSKHKVRRAGKSRCVSRHKQHKRDANTTRRASR